MSKIIVNSAEAPAAIGPYSHAVWAGNLLFVSGQIPFDPKTNQIISSSIEEETHQVMSNLRAILTTAGVTFENVVKCTIFIRNMNDFQRINAVYGEYFKENPPARETVEVSRLPRDVNIEISCIAVKF